jgi:preprotein translocase subunit SecD
MLQKRLTALVVLIVGAGIGYFVYASQVHGWRPFQLGLDLSGGAHLEYSIDTSTVAPSDLSGRLDSLRLLIERRVNPFGVGEPAVQIEQGGVVGTGGHRLVVEIPGVTDVAEAERRISATPTLEFKLVKQGYENKLTDAQGNLNPDAFETTGLTGAYLTGATFQFLPTSGGLSEPAVALSFNSDGNKLFDNITKPNVGRLLAIFLDGQLLSTPLIDQNPGPYITFRNTNSDSATQAKNLAENLNLGALPLNVQLLSAQSIGATLGDLALRAGILAGLIGFLAVVAFMILWYRMPGLVASVALVIYVILMLALFQLIPVVLTAAGIAGFILSVGLAVDANVLIAERMKEELAAGKEGEAAIRQGFARAWPAIRDSNIAHIIAGAVLFWLGTSLIKGFALVFTLGVIVSLFSAITVSRTFLLALGLNTGTRLGRFLMRSGLN